MQYVREKVFSNNKGVLFCLKKKYFYIIKLDGLLQSSSLTSYIPNISFLVNRSVNPDLGLDLKRSGTESLIISWRVKAGGGRE